MKCSFLSLCLVSFLWAGSNALAQESLIFTNVNIINPHTAEIAHHETVSVSNGIITTVADIALIGQVHARVINANGKYLIPGLWDMHVHSAFISPQWDEKSIYSLYIANGVTGVRDMGGDFELLKQRRARIEKGELLGPHLYISGPFLIDAKTDAQTISVKTPVEARAAVDKIKTKVQTLSKFFPASLVNHISRLRMNRRKTAFVSLGTFRIQ